MRKIQRGGNDDNNILTAVILLPSTTYTIPARYITRTHVYALLFSFHFSAPLPPRTWFSMLDAASFVPTNILDLSNYKPDFVAISFHKMFGYPTGLGAILVKNASAHVLNEKNYYGGGTVLLALSADRFHITRPILHER